MNTVRNMLTSAKPNSTEVSDCVCGFLLLNKHYYTYNSIVRDGVCGEVRSIKEKKPTFEARRTCFVGETGEKDRGAEGDCQRGWCRSVEAQTPCTGHRTAPRQKDSSLICRFLGKGKPKSVGERHLPLPQAPTPSAFLAAKNRGKESV